MAAHWYATINIPDGRSNSKWIQSDFSNVQMASRDAVEIYIKTKARIFVSKISSTDVIKLELSTSSDLQIPSR
jgi:hypothetical protein